jgi:hypothetical protein
MIEPEEVDRMKASLAGVSDPRRQWGNLRHNLLDILVIALCTILSGWKDYVNAPANRTKNGSEYRPPRNYK